MAKAYPSTIIEEGYMHKYVHNIQLPQLVDQGVITKYAFEDHQTYQIGSTGLMLVTAWRMETLTKWIIALTIITTIATISNFWL